MNIRTLIWMVCLAVLGTSLGRSQVTVELKLDQQEFLKDESLPVTVRILNLSGQTLRLGTSPTWLQFVVTASDGRLVQQRGPVPVEGEFTLESSHVASRRVDLMPWYSLEELGRYSVDAIVRIEEWGREFASRPVTFVISRGFRLWEQEFGVPGTGSPPEVRKYVLLQANYKKELMLYVRVTDVSGLRVFRVFPAGPLLSFSRPEAQVDQYSRLHLLFQFGARSFKYLVVDPDGQVVKRQTHQIYGTRPRLYVASGGEVFVQGGFRQIAADDLPVPKVPSPPAAGGAVQNASTNAPGKTKDKDAPGNVNPPVVTPSR